MSTIPPLCPVRGCKDPIWCSHTAADAAKTIPVVPAPVTAPVAPAVSQAAPVPVAMAEAGAVLSLFLSQVPAVVASVEATGAGPSVVVLFREVAMLECVGPCDLPELPPLERDENSPTKEVPCPTALAATPTTSTNAPTTEAPATSASPSSAHPRSASTTAIARATGTSSTATPTTAASPKTERQRAVRRSAKCQRAMCGHRFDEHDERGCKLVTVGGDEHGARCQCVAFEAPPYRARQKRTTSQMHAVASDAIEGDGKHERSDRPPEAARGPEGVSVGNDGSPPAPSGSTSHAPALAEAPPAVRSACAEGEAAHDRALAASACGHSRGCLSLGTDGAAYCTACESVGRALGHGVTDGRVGRTEQLAELRAGPAAEGYARAVEESTTAFGVTDAEREEGQADPASPLISLPRRLAPSPHQLSQEDLPCVPAQALLPVRARLQAGPRYRGHLLRQRRSHGPGSVVPGDRQPARSRVRRARRHAARRRGWP